MWPAVSRGCDSERSLLCPASNECFLNNVLHLAKKKKKADASCESHFILFANFLLFSYLFFISKVVFFSLKSWVTPSLSSACGEPPCLIDAFVALFRLVGVPGPSLRTRGQPVPSCCLKLAMLL